MTKEQFLEELKQALAGEVPANVMMDSYSYYFNYIDDEIKNGKSEEEVLEELGKPMLIARSIIAAQTGERSVDYEYTEDGRTRSVRHDPFRNQDRKVKGQSGTSSNSGGQSERQFSFDLSGVLARVAFFFFLIFLVLIVFFVIKIGFWVLVTFGIPILLILGIIYLVMYFAGGGRKM